MATKLDSFQAKLAQGRSGEKRVAEQLQEHGWYVIPSYDYSGEDGDKAPRLQGIEEAFAVPDLDIAKGGERRWAEVKTKSAATYTRETKRLEHGIPLRHYRGYQRIQEITGTKVWLFICENDTGQVRYAKLDDLEQRKRVYPGDKMDRGGTVFFPRDAFAVFAN